MREAYILVIGGYILVREAKKLVCETIKHRLYVYKHRVEAIKLRIEAVKHRIVVYKHSCEAIKHKIDGYLITTRRIDCFITLAKTLFNNNAFF